MQEMDLGLASVELASLRAERPVTRPRRGAHGCVMIASLHARRLRVPLRVRLHRDAQVALAIKQAEMVAAAIEAQHPRHHHHDRAARFGRRPKFAPRRAARAGWRRLHHAHRRCRPRARLRRRRPLAERRAADESLESGTRHRVLSAARQPARRARRRGVAWRRCRRMRASARRRCAARRSCAQRGPTSNWSTCAAASARVWRSSTPAALTRCAWRPPASRASARVRSPAARMESCRPT